jgi:energy-coupling factor transporter ATP-binding protein EcfA2
VSAGPARVAARGWGWRHAARRDWALRDVDLVVAPGERVLLLGPSGAGKSTLLAALAGLLDPDASGTAEGALAVDGRPAREARARTGLVLQDPEAQLVMARAGDDVAFGLENRAVPPELIWPRVDRALDEVGFPYGRDRPTSALSGGEKQRLALAGALALRPGLLLLDEPTANLDPAGAALVRDVLKTVTDVTLVLVEHRVEQALPLVDRVVVLAPGGGVVADGRPGRVLTGPLADRLARDGVWLPGRRTAPRRAVRPPGPEVVRSTARHPRSSARDLALHEGEAVAVTGPNGAGKSTLALLLAGLLAPAQGAVTAVGPGAPSAPLHRWRARALAALVGTVFQEPEHQFLTSTVRAELDLGTDGRRTDALLERLRLAHLAEANPFTLSGGENRRLSVATALAAAPRVLVLDEPTFGQDARTWAELLALLAELRDEGRAVLTVTHDEELTAALADRTVAL